MQDCVTRHYVWIGGESIYQNLVYFALLLTCDRARWKIGFIQEVRFPTPYQYLKVNMMVKVLNC